MGWLETRGCSTQEGNLRPRRVVPFEAASSTIMRRFQIVTALLVALLPLVAVDSQSAPASAPVVERWIDAAALPLRSVEVDGDLHDLQPLARVIGSSGIVALGESTHGAHEPLAVRNRLFRFLVERLGFTAIALETGLPESRAIAVFVAGGRGAASD